jgi:Ion channel
MLLLLLVGSFVALGFSEHRWVRVFAVGLQLAALVVGFLATGLRRDHKWLGAFALVGVVATVLVAIEGETVNGIGEIAGVIVLGALLVALLDRVLRHEHVTMQTLFGAVCAYFLIGLMFSGVYGALNDLGSASLFGDTVDQSVFSYFSFTTLTTVGFGDYTATTDLGRRIAVIEAVLGQVFLATTVARLVSLYKSSQPALPDSNR